MLLVFFCINSRFCCRSYFALEWNHLLIFILNPLTICTYKIIFLLFYDWVFSVTLSNILHSMLYRQSAIEKYSFLDPIKYTCTNTYRMNVVENLRIIIGQSRCAWNINHHNSLYWTPTIDYIWHLSSFLIFNINPCAEKKRKKNEESFLYQKYCVFVSLFVSWTWMNDLNVILRQTKVTVIITFHTGPDSLPEVTWNIIRFGCLLYYITILPPIIRNWLGGVRSNKS